MTVATTGSSTRLPSFKRRTADFIDESIDAMSSEVAKPTIDQRGFWLTHEEGHIFDVDLAQALVDVFPRDRICDLGCGPGKYVSFLRERQVECDGFDGNPNTPEVTGGTCGVLDLSEPIQLEREYDVIISLEVAEHIPRKYQDAYLANLTAHAKHWLVMSWAVPGQAGDGHVNNRPNTFAVWKIQQLGFQLDLSKTALLRERASLFWFKNTLLVFSRGTPSKATALKSYATALRFDAQALRRKVTAVAGSLLGRST